MAKSISQAQAEADAEGFLDRQGNDKTLFRPVKLLSQVELIAGSIAKEAQKNLVKNTASGRLSESIEITELTKEGSIYSTKVTMLYYGQFVNKGVKGVVSGSSTANYAFKNLGVSAAFIKSLEQGKGRATKKISNIDTKKTISQNEKKNATVSDSAVWGAAKNIKKYGIKTTSFMDKAIDTISSKVEKQLGVALRIDVENNLRNDN